MNENNNIKISLAPLQGLTDYIFRNAFASFFEGIDLSYSPFLRIERGEVRKSRLRDILPENNKSLELIPQILTKDSEEFLYLASLVTDKGYKEINLNMGCPYPMVVKQGMGSGMLPHPDKLKKLLDDVVEKIDCKLSIKMRTGYESHEEILDLLPVLNNYPLSKIIIHPRTGKQMYKGEVDIDAFRNCLGITDKDICYNGDISDIDSFNSFRNDFPEINDIMIGRGIIGNPFLPAEIKGISIEGDKKEIVTKFHNTIFEEYSSLLSGDAHILNRMIPFWEYLSSSFSNSRKVFKAIKKSSSVKKYETNVRTVLKNEDWIK